MKILDNHVVREMTDEEIEKLYGGEQERMSETEQKAAAYDILTGVSE